MFNFMKKHDSQKVASKNTANDRLRLVLTHDRIGASTQFMDNLKEEIIQVIIKHVEVAGRPEVTIISEGRRSALDINIPLKGR